MNDRDRLKPDLVVNLALFTIVTPETLAGSLWADSLIRTDKLSTPTDIGTGLYVVTMRDPDTNENVRILPGDFVVNDETIDETSKRIVWDILGIKAKVKLRQISIFDKPQFGNHRREISIPYWGAIAFEDLRMFLGGRNEVGLELVTSTEFIDRWEHEHNGLDEFDGVSRFGHRLNPNLTRGHVKRSSKDVSGFEILGRGHDEIVFYAWRKLRHAFTGRLDPFRYLGVLPFGSQFRISDLQDFRDVARGEKSQADQFRRSMLQSELALLRETNKLDSSKRGKPARLYELNMSMPDNDLDADDEL
jgi:ADP-ribose pyrophosphatase YjhB (NUDIX family)